MPPQWCARRTHISTFCADKQLPNRKLPPPGDLTSATPTCCIPFDSPTRGQLRTATYVVSTSTRMSGIDEIQTRQNHSKNCCRNTNRQARARAASPATRANTTQCANPHISYIARTAVTWATTYVGRTVQIVLKQHFCENAQCIRFACIFAWETAFPAPKTHTRHGPRLARAWASTQTRFYAERIGHGKSHFRAPTVAHSRTAGRAGRRRVGPRAVSPSAERSRGIGQGPGEGARGVGRCAVGGSEIGVRAAAASSAQPEAQQGCEGAGRGSKSGGAQGEGG